MIAVLMATGGGTMATAQPSTTPAAPTTTVPQVLQQQAPVPADPCATTTAPTTTAATLSTTTPATLTSCTTVPSAPAPAPAVAPGGAPAEQATTTSVTAPAPTDTPELAPAQLPAEPAPVEPVAPTDPDLSSKTAEPDPDYTPTEDPNATIVPGQMRSDREEIPAPFTKEDADIAETMEARQRMTRAAVGCQTYWPSPYEVCGAIRDKYNSLGGPGSFLSYPYSPEYTSNDGIGKRSLFLNGPIYWSPQGGAHPVVNSFLNRWGVHQYEEGFLKYPTTDEIVLPDGGRRQEFQQGAIYVAFQNAIGSAIANGPLRDKYNSVGGLTPGSSFLGYLTEDHIRTLPDGQGQMARFQNGVIYYHPVHGAHTVVGEILTKWSQTGYEGGYLRYPTTDGTINSDGIGRHQEFYGAAIYSHPTRGRVSVVGGEIRSKWNALGAEAGDLGYPTGDEVNTPQELTYSGSRMNTFEAGIITWGATLGAADGQWYIADSSSPGVASRAIEPALNVKIRPGGALETPCPAEAVHEEDSEYGCEKAWPNSPYYGGKVISRYGRPDAYAYSGHGAFGTLHALNDHNLGLNAMGKIINVSRRVPIGLRVEYQAEFRMRDANPLRALVRVQETPMTEQGHEDEYAMGVVTGYCKTGPEAGEGYCPAWVNETL